MRFGESTGFLSLRKRASGARNDGDAQKLTGLLPVFSPLISHPIVSRRSRGEQRYVIIAIMKRRTFLRAAGAAASLGVVRDGAPRPRTRPVRLILIDPADPIAFGARPKWAAPGALGPPADAEYRGPGCAIDRQAAAGDDLRCRQRPGSHAPGASNLPAAAESFAISNAPRSVGDVFCASRAAIRAVSRTRCSSWPIGSNTKPARSRLSRFTRPSSNNPPTAFAASCVPFVSEVEDKPWYYDRGAWRELPDDARHASFQPVQPELRHWLRLRQRDSRLLFSLHLSIPAQAFPATTSRSPSRRPLAANLAC